MKHAILWSLVLTVCFAALHAAPQDTNPPMPRYAGQNLIRPENYREWIFLSSGLGMNYNPSPGAHEMFTNVFVPQCSYRQFLARGKWPHKTIFVAQERGSQSEGSINKTGHFQTDLVGMGVEVKDETRFAEKWAYFNFGADTKAAGANPKAACWLCHDDHAAVEHTFVQFYPTLKDVAKKFGTIATRRKMFHPLNKCGRGLPRISDRPSGSRVMISIRPARLSDTWGRASTLAEPVSRKRPGRRSASTDFLMARNSSGAR
jgi:hypothetical protein